MHSISLHHRAVPMKASPLRATLTTKIPLLRDDEPELVETQRRLDDARAMSSMVNGEMTYTDIARIAGWPVEPVNDWKADASSDRGRMSTLAPGDARGRRPVHGACPRTQAAAVRTHAGSRWSHSRTKRQACTPGRNPGSKGGKRPVRGAWHGYRQGRCTGAERPRGRSAH